MQAINRHSIEKFNLPVDGYNYIVKTSTSVDGGKTFYYCGNSRYFRTLEEAEAYKTERERAK